MAILGGFGGGGWVAGPAAGVCGIGFERREVVGGRCLEFFEQEEEKEVDYIHLD